MDNSVPAEQPTKVIARLDRLWHSFDKATRGMSFNDCEVMAAAMAAHLYRCLRDKSMFTVLLQAQEEEAAKEKQLN